VESYFDLHPAVGGFAVWPKGRLHLPFAYLRQRFLIQAHPRTSEHHSIFHFAIGGHGDVQQDSPRAFRAPRFIGIFWLRTVKALWRASSIYSRTWQLASGFHLLLRAGGTCGYETAEQQGNKDSTRFAHQQPPISEKDAILVATPRKISSA
jgi:hypothetical protein